MRGTISAMMSFIMIQVMMFGGCLSCERFYVFPSFAKDATHCCEKSGTCSRPTDSSAKVKDCKRAPLEVTASAAAIQPDASFSWTVDAFRTASRTALHAAPESRAQSPPSLNTLLCVFLI